jgi:hypothetical protein
MDMSQSYNTYANLPYLSYYIITHIVNNNEDIWKLLKYLDNNPLEKANLTREEKSELIYRGSGDANNFRVFSDWGVDDAITAQIPMLRISSLEVAPSSYVVGNQMIGFEIYAHYKINTLIDATSRTTRIVQQLLETLNGKNIDGIGKLFFDPKTRNNIRLIGQINYKGLMLTMCNFALG